MPPKSKLVGLLFGSWEDADRVYAGLSDADALAHPSGGSSFAWTLMHISRSLDVWFNVPGAGAKPNTRFAAELARGLPSGVAADFTEIKAGTSEVRTQARAYLDQFTDAALDSTIVNAGTRWGDVSLRYLVSRAIAHTYFHVGEVAAKRDQMGHKVGDYPGALTDAQ